MKVSLFASAVRPRIWPELFKSLDSTTISYEVVFCGNVVPHDFGYGSDKPNFKYIEVANLKPAQCYEIARRNCTGEVVVWIADDMEFPNDIIGKAYTYWKSQNNKKLILSLQTKESGYGQKDGKLFPMKEHTFYSLMSDTPLMAPVAMLSREYLQELGGLDRRYVCGQYENDIVMRAYQDGAKVEIFGGEDCYVDIDHLGKSIFIGESVDEETFRERPFAKGYSIDREMLEKSWTTFDSNDAFKRLEAGERPFSLRRVSTTQLDKFEPYSEIDLLTKSQSNNLWDRWE